MPDMNVTRYGQEKTGETYLKRLISNKKKHAQGKRGPGAPEATGAADCNYSYKS